MKPGLGAQLSVGQALFVPTDYFYANIGDWISFLQRTDVYRLLNEEKNRPGMVQGLN